MTREYPPGFSPEEREARARRNPKDKVEIITQYSDKFYKYMLRISENTKRLQELCDDWKPEHYQEYLGIIDELCNLFYELEYLSKFGKTLREWHSY